MDDPICWHSPGQILWLFLICNRLIISAAPSELSYIYKYIFIYLSRAISVLPPQTNDFLQHCATPKDISSCRCHGTDPAHSLISP